VDYYANAAAERALVGGALLFWEDFAPYAGRVRAELFADGDLWLVWRAAEQGHDVTAVPPYLQVKALEYIDAYQGQAPDVLIARLEDAIPRRRLQIVATDIVAAIDAGEEVADIVAAARAGLAEITEMETIDD